MPGTAGGGAAFARNHADIHPQGKGAAPRAASLSLFRWPLLLAAILRDLLDSPDSLLHLALRLILVALEPSFLPSRHPSLGSLHISSSRFHVCRHISLVSVFVVVDCVYFEMERNGEIILTRMINGGGRCKQYTVYVYIHTYVYIYIHIYKYVWVELVAVLLLAPWREEEVVGRQLVRMIDA